MSPSATPASSSCFPPRPWKSSQRSRPRRAPIPRRFRRPVTGSTPFCRARTVPRSTKHEGPVMTPAGLLVLSRADIVRLMNYSDYVDAVEAAFRAAVEGRAVAPPASALHVPNGSFPAKGAALLGHDAKVAIKINGNFPGNPASNGLPTVQGIIYLADGANGRPLAVMDSIEGTHNPTGRAPHPG